MGEWISKALFYGRGQPPCIVDYRGTSLDCGTFEMEEGEKGAVNEKVVELIGRMSGLMLASNSAKTGPRRVALRA
jgi:hypothetical protein